MKKVILSDGQMNFFKIVDVGGTVPWTYKLCDLKGEEILGSFYSQELQKTTIN